ncbi:MAG: PepSY domain-containing protein [Nitrososphaera sp.]
MKTILIIAAVAIAASLAVALPLFHSSFAAPGQTASPDSLQNPATQVSDKETNEDGDDAADSVDPQLASQAKITADQAKSIATEHTSAQPSDVKSVSVEDENGQLVYSVEIANAGNLFDVEVDAIAGQVLTVEQETEGETDDDAETNDDQDEGGDDHGDRKQADN